MLLTTHYMDEADALAQRIGIMAGGELKVLGSPQHLKSRHGGGYRVELNGPAAAAERMGALVRRLCADATLLEAHAGTQAYEVDAVDMPTAFRELEAVCKTKKLDFKEKQEEWKKNGQWHVEVY